MPPELEVVLWLTAWVMVLLCCAAAADRWRERRRLRFLLNRSRGLPGRAVHVASWDDVMTALANGYVVTADDLPDGPEPSVELYPCGDGHHRHATPNEAQACVLMRSVWTDQEVAR